MCIYIYIYIYTHTHTHTQIAGSNNINIYKLLPVSCFAIETHYMLNEALFINKIFCIELFTITAND